MVASLVGAVAAIVVAALVSFTEASRIHLLPRNQSTGCETLYQQYPSLVSFPNSTVYETENDIASAVKILVQTNTKFAVRGGGHMPIPGAASTNDGILIAMDNIAAVEVDQVGSQTVAKIGTGSRWTDVYEHLAAQQLTAIGGRYAPVGVGGYTLGGGVSYYLSTRGWAANHVVNYEIVDAAGDILQVNATSYPYLFWALKGGSNNFGIATRFDLETFPLIDIYGGFLTSNETYVNDVLQAVADYITPSTGGNFDPLAAVAPNLEFTTDTRAITAVTSLFYNRTVSTSPKAFENFTAIPAIPDLSGAAQQSLLSFMNSTVATGDRNSNKLFGATSLNGTPESVSLSAQVWLDEIKTLKNVTGGIVTIGFQMIARSSLEAAVTAGGDAISLDPTNGAVMTLLVSSQYERASDTEYLRGWIDRVLAKIEEKAKAAGIYYPFIYLNDSGEGEAVLELYGHGKSFPKMKAIAAKYDPNGVFQRLLAGAFKLS